MHKFYVASSWRNMRQPGIVQALRDAGHEAYDFKDPLDNGGTGFQWSEIDKDWKTWTPAQFRQALRHPIATVGFKRDWDAMNWADAFVLVMPCGRSAHLELGWAVGAGKPTAILLADGEPELMYEMVTKLCITEEELLDWSMFPEAPF